MERKATLRVRPGVAADAAVEMESWRVSVLRENPAFAGPSHPTPPPHGPCEHKNVYRIRDTGPHARIQGRKPLSFVAGVSTDGVDADVAAGPAAAGSVQRTLEARLATLRCVVVSMAALVGLLALFLVLCTVRDCGCPDDDNGTPSSSGSVGEPQSPQLSKIAQLGVLGGIW